MYAPSTYGLLAAWEQGASRHPAERALALLAAAYPNFTPDARSAWSIGQRDAALMDLRKWAFGPQMESLCACPSCGQHLEMTLSASDFFHTPAASQPGESSLSVTGYELRFRLPNSNDLLACSETDPAGMRKRLLECCVDVKNSNGEKVSTDHLPEEVISVVIENMEKADPRANIEVPLSCPACDHRWSECFDIVLFLWSEIDAWARRVLHEVHVLASAYGWRESDILALSPWRRQFYIEMTGL